MKVKDLIAKLQKEDPDMEVVVWGGVDSRWPTKGVVKECCDPTHEKRRNLTLKCYHHIWPLVTKNDSHAVKVLRIL